MKTSKLLVYFFAHTLYFVVAFFGYVIILLIWENISFSYL